MSARRTAMFLASAVSLASLVQATGCGPADREPEVAGHHHHDDDDDHHHDHDEAGVAFKPGTGLVLTEEARQLLGVQTAVASLRPVAREVRLTARVFGEHQPHRAGDPNPPGCALHASGLVPDPNLAGLAPGLGVEVLGHANAPTRGVVLGVQRVPTSGETEVLLGVAGMGVLKPGDFIPVRIRVDRETPVTAIPAGAVLWTSEGSFVYAAQDGACLRTAVQTGAESEGWVEITQGLSPGAVIVTSPLQTLWLVELRATRGGGHSH